MSSPFSRLRTAYICTVRGILSVAPDSPFEPDDVGLIYPAATPGMSYVHAPG